MTPPPNGMVPDLLCEAIQIFLLTPCGVVGFLAPMNINSFTSSFFLLRGGCSCSHKCHFAISVDSIQTSSPCGIGGGLPSITEHSLLKSFKSPPLSPVVLVAFLHPQLSALSQLTVSQQQLAVLFIEAALIWNCLRPVGSALRLWFWSVRSSVLSSPVVWVVGDMHHPCDWWLLQSCHIRKQ